VNLDVGFSAFYLLWFAMLLTVWSGVAYFQKFLVALLRGQR
jgi:hypothetical protein